MYVGGLGVRGRALLVFPCVCHCSYSVSSILSGVVGRLIVLASESRRLLTDDVPEVRQFCQELEVILRHQQKGLLHLVICDNSIHMCAGVDVHMCAGVDVRTYV